jgi:hypothetical protein
MANSLETDDKPVLKANVYLKHAQALVEQTVGKEKFIGRMRATRKEMKADGVNLRAFNLVRQLSKLDEEERLEMLEAARVMAGWEGIAMPPAWRPGSNDEPQGAFEIDEPSPEIRQGHRDAVITSDAYNSRKAGGERQDNPHNPGERDHQTWDHAWIDTDDELKPPMVQMPEAAVEPAPTAEKPARKARAPKADAADVDDAASIH